MQNTQISKLRLTLGCGRCVHASCLKWRY